MPRRILFGELILWCGGFCLVAPAAQSAEPSSAPLEVVDLRCEHLVSPLGIDDLQPRLSWKLRATSEELRAQRQSAYRVLVASDPGLLDRNRGDLWDSGRVAVGPVASRPICRSADGVANAMLVEGPSVGRIGERLGMERSRDVVHGFTDAGRLAGRPVDRSGRGGRIRALTSSTSRRPAGCGTRKGTPPKMLPSRRGTSEGGSSCLRIDGWSARTVFSRETTSSRSTSTVRKWVSAVDIPRSSALI